MRTHQFLMFLALTAGCSEAVSSEEGSNTDPNEPAQNSEDLGEGVADLRADTNRDGVVRFDDPGDDQNEDTWNATHGAVFLANIDDDQVGCPKTGSDLELAKCNDAADETVNGADDALDLARLKTKPWPAAPAGAKGSITFTAASQVRLFEVNGNQFTAIPSGHALTQAELASGVELAIEGKDIVRDASVWDGYVDVTFTIDAPASGGNPATKASDKVRLRVAPVITPSHLLEPVQTWVSNTGDSGNKALRTDLGAIASAAGVAAPTTIPTDDPWAQDFFETAYMSMPAAGGKQHVIRVAYRSANVFSKSMSSPLRPAGKVVFAMRGKDQAAIQQFDRNHSQNMDSLNSFGNFETIPPYAKGGQSYPLGRVLRGNAPKMHPDPTFLKMVEGQAVQPPVYVDTSWLLVGHVDETLSFVRAPSARGWALLVNDATLATNMLKAQENAGHGNVPMFVGKYWDTKSPAQVTIAQVLSDADVMGASSEAAVEVASQLQVLKSETGLTDAEIVKVPFLHMPMDGGSIAYQPGMVNGLYMTPTTFVAPDPHGPVVNGKDIFQDAMATALQPLGVTVKFAEDWDGYHRNEGEVHCGTNATRAIPDTKWWETGR